MAPMNCAFCGGAIARDHDEYRIFDCRLDSTGTKMAMHLAHYPQCVLQDRCMVCTCARCKTHGVSYEQENGTEKFLVKCANCEARCHVKCLGACPICNEPMLRARKSVSPFRTFFGGGRLVINRDTLPTLTKDALREQNITMNTIAASDLTLGDLVDTLHMTWKDLRITHGFSKRNLKHFWDAAALLRCGATWQILQSDLQIFADNLVALQPSAADLQLLQCTGKDLQLMHFGFIHFMRLPWDATDLIVRLNFNLDQFMPRITKEQQRKLVQERGLTRDLLEATPAVTPRRKP